MADSYLTSIQQQSEQARQSIASQQSAANREIGNQAEQERERLRREGSDYERQAQQALQQTRRKRDVARRASKEIGITLETPAKGTEANIERQRAEGISLYKKAGEEVTKAEEKAKAEVESNVKTAIAELEKQEQTAIADYQEYMKDKIELDNGDIMLKSDYEAVPFEDQQLLKEHGIAFFNDIMAGRRAEFESQNTKVGISTDKEEWVTNEFYNSLPTKQQEYLRNNGIEAWENKYTHKIDNGQSSVPIDVWDNLSDDDKDYLETHNLDQYENHIAHDTYYNSYLPVAGEAAVTLKDWQNMSNKERQKLYNSTLSANYILLDTGEYIDRITFNSLPTDKQQVLQSKGIAAFNSQLEAEQKEFEAKNIQTNTGEWLDREWVNSLNDEEKSYVLSNGLDSYYNKYYVNVGSDNMVRKDFAQTHVQLKTGEWVESEWLNSLPAIVQTSVIQEGIKGLDSWYVKCDNGEYIDRNYFNSFTAEEQKAIRIGGAKAAENIIAVNIKNNYVELNNGELIAKDNFNLMSPEDQKLLKQLGTVGFNLQKEQELRDYINSLPPKAQEYIKTHGLEQFNQIMEQADKADPQKAFGLMQQIGLLPKDEELGGRLDYNTIKRNSKGELEYALLPASPKIAIARNLNDIDYNNLSQQDFYDIAFTIRQNPKLIGKTASAIAGAGDYGLVRRYAETLPVAQHKQLMVVADRIRDDELINVATFVFPPAQALKPDVTLKDIRGIDWAIGAAQIALLVATPALGAVAKTSGVAGKVAGLSSKAIQTGAVATFGVATAIDWKNMSVTERMLNTALNIAFVGLLFGKPILKGINRFVSKEILGTTDYKLMASAKNELERIARAVKAGNIQVIKTSASRLKTIGSGMENKSIGSNIIRNSEFIKSNAKAIAKLEVSLESNLLSEIDTEIAGYKGLNIKQRINYQKIVAKAGKIEVKAQPLAQKGLGEDVIKYARGIQRNAITLAKQANIKPTIKGLENIAKQVTKANVKVITTKQVINLAKESGIRGKYIASVLNKNKSISSAALIESRAGAKLQKLIQKSIASDEKFIDSLSRSPRMTAKQLIKIEKLSGTKGIAKVIRSIYKSSDELRGILSKLSKIKKGTKEYLELSTKAIQTEAKLTRAISLYKNMPRIRYVAHMIDIPESSLSKFLDRMLVEKSRQKMLEEWANQLTQARYAEESWVRNIYENMWETEKAIDAYYGGFKSAPAGEFAETISDIEKFLNLGDDIKSIESWLAENRKVPIDTSPVSPSSSVATLEKIDVKVQQQSELPFTQRIVKPAETEVSATSKIKLGNENISMPETEMRMRIREWQSMTPVRAIEQMLSSNLTVLALATNAKAITQILQNTNNATQTKVLNTVEGKTNTAIRNMVQQAISPSVSVAIRTIAQNEVQALAKTAIQTAVKTRTATKIQPKIELKISPAIEKQAQIQSEAAIQTATKTQQKQATQTSEATKSQTKTESKTQTEKGTKVETKTQAKTDVVKDIVKSDTTKVVKPDTTKIEDWDKGKRYRPIKVELPDGSSHVLTEKEFYGTVGWKQGFIYKYVFPPYGNNQTFNSRLPVEGLKIVDGIGSAYRTIAQLEPGKLPPTIHLDMGIMNVAIKTSGKKQPRIQFTREDTKPKTMRIGR